MEGKDTNKLRYERKFVVSELKSYEIEHLIKHNPAMFSEIFYERRVNNIYLDSRDLKNYRENLAGISERIKIRIRWYGKIFGLIRKPVLELKIKKSELGKKLSYPLESFTLDKNFSLDLLQKIFLKSNLPQRLIEELKLLHPTLINSYKRKYFISADKKYRITLDKEQIFFRIKNRQNLFNEKITNKETCIIELKYLLKDYENAKNITEYFPFRLIANSKYIRGVDLLEGD